MLIDPQPEERFVELLSMADCHVLPQRPGVTNYVMPSKLGPMLASGRPVVMQADPEDEVLMQLADGCMITPSSDTLALVAAIRAAVANKAVVSKGGARARQRVQELFDKERVLANLVPVYTT